ncbi:Crp/Fnr family transcriptional regulator [Paenibacillus antri]|uniref:Crp/Fnr family transcriptional regulator n=1 Tax=Paenibacillus antri TaxID=2582848 RepID=A0A5R9G6P4_9BACL|nr:Crp/Fnr family transcriptional regulator [Paenibacillus antri]TLS50719.1 Crp/Fnr family transcriptional regulator [Paenibacillus antri]
MAVALKYIEPKQEQQGAAPQARGFAQYVTEEQLQSMEAMMQWKKAAKGTYLFWEGDEADKLYYVRSGQVKLLKSTEEGKDLIVSVLQKGDLIAEMGGFQDSKHGYSAQAMQNAEIGILSKKDLSTLFSRNDGLSLQFMYWLGLSQRVVQSKLRDLLLYGKPGALASTLIRMANSCGTKQKDGSYRIDLKLTNAELGDMIGATRESVNRMLSEWKDAGTLDVVDGKLRILRIDDLRGMCNCPTGSPCPLEVCRL